MNIQEIYDLGIAQGWDEGDAYYLAQIAWAESAGDIKAVVPDTGGTTSYGLWQINSIHLDKLIGAAIIESWEDLADPIANATAAYYVAHHLDKTPGSELSEEFKDKWDFSRFSSTGLPSTNLNHPSNYGSEIIRDEVQPSDTPPDILGTPPGGASYQDWLALEQSIRNAPTTTDDNVQARLDAMNDALEAGYSPEEITGALASFVGPEAFEDRQTTVEPPPYSPTEFTLPMGWLDLWGEDNTVIDAWLDDWITRFNDNRAKDVPYTEEVLIDDFYNHADYGLYAQTWWGEKTTPYLDMVKQWYTGGGPGTSLGGDAPFPEAGTSEESAERLINQWDTWEGTGDWKFLWDKSIVFIKDAAENLLGADVELDDAFVNRLAFQLMASGGATERESSGDAEAWRQKALQIIQTELITKYRGDDLGELGPGQIEDVIKDIYSHAASQMVDADTVAMGMGTTVENWALDIMGEQGLNLDQVFAKMDTAAYGRWGMTEEQIEQLGGTTITDKIGPLWMTAMELWEDTSVPKTDQWLMDNYQVTAEDGTTRFRTAPEMRDAARANLDRLQNSSKYYQDPMNKFILGAARIFRSDY